MCVIAALIVAALVIWFAAVRRMLYPVIKVTQLVLTGPGSYYLTRKIKGARRVVLTSHRRSQNALSRLFTGTIIYIVADHFTPDITLEPKGSGKRVRAASPRGASGWDFTPTPSFARYEKGAATSRTNPKDKFEIEFQ